MEFFTLFISLIQWSPFTFVLSFYIEKWENTNGKLIVRNEISKTKKIEISERNERNSSKKGNWKNFNSRNENSEKLIYRKKLKYSLQIIYYSGTIRTPYLWFYEYIKNWTLGIHLKKMLSVLKYFVGCVW